LLNNLIQIKLYFAYFMLLVTRIVI
jgi:hypothetical protein